MPADQNVSDKVSLTLRSGIRRYSFYTSEDKIRKIWRADCINILFLLRKGNAGTLNVKLKQKWAWKPTHDRAYRSNDVRPPIVGLLDADWNATTRVPSDLDENVRVISLMSRSVRSITTHWEGLCGSPPRSDGLSDDSPLFALKFCPLWEGSTEKHRIARSYAGRVTTRHSECTWMGHSSARSNHQDQLLDGWRFGPYRVCNSDQQDTTPTVLQAKTRIDVISLWTWRFNRQFDMTCISAACLAQIWKFFRLRDTATTVVGPILPFENKVIWSTTYRTLSESSWRYKNWSVKTFSCQRYQSHFFRCRKIILAPNAQPMKTIHLVNEGRDTQIWIRLWSRNSRYCSRKSRSVSLLRGMIQYRYYEKGKAGDDSTSCLLLTSWIIGRALCIKKMHCFTVLKHENFHSFISSFGFALQLMLQLVSFLQF